MFRPEIVQSIDQNAQSIRRAAEELTNRIVLFQEYLVNLPGRVETYLCLSHPDYPPIDRMELVLKLHREGKAWILSWATDHPNRDPDDEANYSPLKDAPLRIKMEAVKHFPDFLEGVEKSQEMLKIELQHVTAAFDEFAKTLPARSAAK